MNQKPTPKKVDVLISDVPYEVYKEMRIDLMKKGYHVQGFEKKFCEPSGEKV